MSDLVSFVGDPFADLFRRWEDDLQHHTERAVNEEMASLVRTHQADLEAAIERVGELRVLYAHAEDLTGYSIGALMNNPAIPNVGTRGKGEFRLADLPFKAGYTPPSHWLRTIRSIQKSRRGMTAHERVARDRGRRAG